MAAPATVDFDFEDVLPTVQRAHSRANRDDAEEAVQTAVAEMLEKGEPLIAPFVVQKARSRLSNALSRRERGNASLNAFEEEEERDDRPPKAIAIVEDDLDDLLATADLDEISLRVLRIVDRGGAPYLAPRGALHPSAKHSDEQMAQVRQLRQQGMTFVEIEQATGVSRYLASAHMRRRVRVADSEPGWTRELAVAALCAHRTLLGRVPRLRDLEGNPATPSPKTLERLFGSFVAALEAAGMESVYADRSSQRWTPKRIAEALLDFHRQEGRWPVEAELERGDRALPSPATLGRQYRVKVGSPDLARRVKAAMEGRDHLLLERPRRRCWTPEKIIAALRAHGRAPLVKELHTDPALPSYNVVKYHFTTLDAAARAAGYDGLLRQRRTRWTPWSVDEVLAAIAAYEDREGTLPGSGTYDYDEDLPSASTIYKLLGSAAQAVIAQHVVAYRAEQGQVLRPLPQDGLCSRVKRYAERTIEISGGGGLTRHLIPSPA